MIRWTIIRNLRNCLDMHDLNWQSVINMTNGIIGVSVLAMPYCFSQCGVILGTLVLIFSAYITSYSCKILLEASDIKSIRTLEYLAFRTIGPNGKLFVEISIIFLLFGIKFF
jgi:solute carrier family 38 (sodium-coupled neutral amino acid transporter), member 10